MSPRTQYAKGVAKRDEILRAALKVFTENGYLKTSIRDIAEASNLSQAGLLHYFGSKEELLVAVLQRREDEHAAIRGDEDAVDDLFQRVGGNVEAPGLAQLFATMSTAAIAEGHPAHAFFAQHYDDLRAELAAALRHRQEEGSLDAAVDADRLASVLVAAADGLQIQWLVDEQLDMPGALEYLWSLVARPA